MKKLILLLLIIPTLSFNSSKTSIDIVGKWAGEDKGQMGYITFDKEGFATFEIGGEVIGGKEFVLDGKKGSMAYKIINDKSPLEINLTITKFESNEQQTILCLAKFEDENNMTFATDFNSIRPTEFNEENAIQLKRVE